MTKASQYAAEVIDTPLFHRQVQRFETSTQVQEALSGLAKSGVITMWHPSSGSATNALAKQVVHSRDLDQSYRVADASRGENGHHTPGIMKKRVILLPLIDPVFVPVFWAVPKLSSASTVPTAQGLFCTMRGPAWSVRFVTLFA